jgi:hypothetical protein
MVYVTIMDVVVILAIWSILWSILGVYYGARCGKTCFFLLTNIIARILFFNYIVLNYAIRYDKDIDPDNPQLGIKLARV